MLNPYKKLSFDVWRDRAFDLMHYHICKDRRGLGDWVEQAVSYPWRQWYGWSWHVSTAAHEGLSRLGWETDEAISDYERIKPRTMEC